jgi:hypothetical protein
LNALQSVLLDGRGTLDVERNDALSPNQDQTENSLLLSLLLALALGRDLSVLLAIAEHEVHVFVEGHEFAHQRPSIFDSNFHTIVDELEHLTAL